MKINLVKENCCISLVFAALMVVGVGIRAELSAVLEPEVLRVWPGQAPGSEQWEGEEFSEIQPNRLGEIELKRNVSVPTLTVFRPLPEKANGTAMLVLPGGAFGALAWDLEGVEIATWLAERGITAFLLKYRVRSWPAPEGVTLETPADYIPLLERGRTIAVEDASEAVRLIRNRAEQFGIEADRVGMIGFSAGAVTSFGVVLQAAESAHPDFLASIYGFTMMEEPVMPAEAPPLFLVAAQDDGLITAAHNQQIYGLWVDGNRPIELHLYEKGGHGFGMRPQGLPVDAWPIAFEAWLDSQGLMSSAEE